MYAEINKELENSFSMSDYPLNIAIEVTNHCNLNCIMCKNDSLTRSRGFMDGSTYRKIIDETARENPGARLWLDFYGEAMLVGYKLYWMIDYAKKNGCKNVCINTNGTLLKREYADFLLDSGVDFISLDCDGYSADVYETIRVGASRDVFYKNVEYLLREKKRRKSSTIIDIKVIDMKQNHNEIDLILNYWRERGAYVAVRRESKWIDGNEASLLDNANKTQRIVCGHAVGICAITWDGFMTDCVWDYDCKMTRGSILKRSIKELWNERNREFLSKHFEHRWDDLPNMCRKCNDWINIGEERYTPCGDSIERNYGINEKMY